MMNIYGLNKAPQKITVITDMQTYTFEDSRMVIWMAGQKIKEMLITENDIIVVL